MMKTSSIDHDNTVRNILLVFLFVLVFYLMKELSSLLAPLFFALFFALMFIPLIERLKRKVPSYLALPIIAVISLGAIFLVFNIIFHSIMEVIEQKDVLLLNLQVRIHDLFIWVNNRFGTHYETDSAYYEISKMLNPEFIASNASYLLGGLSHFTGSFLMFSLYYILILMGLSNYRNYLNYIGGEKLAPYFDTVKRSVLSYLFVKTIVSIIVGVVTYLICLTFGVKFAFTWAFITFLMNFVPNIGAIASTVLPAAMHLIQYGSIEMMIFLILSLIAVHNIMGNLIEPKWLGSNLRLNTVVVLFGLVFWGYIWGIPGMMISVPLMVILKLIFEFSPNTAIFARLMSYPDTAEED